MLIGEIFNRLFYYDEYGGAKKTFMNKAEINGKLLCDIWDKVVDIYIY